MIHAEYVEFDQPTGARVRRLEVFGHAGYAPRGQDIVCAGASMLMETLVYVLADCDEAECCVYNEPTGPRVSVKLTGSIYPTDLTAMEFAKTGLALLAERYPANIHYEDKSQDGQEKMVNLQLFADGAGGDGGAAAGTDAGGEGQQAAAIEMPKLRPAEERLARRSGVLKRSGQLSQPGSDKPSQSKPDGFASSPKGGADASAGEADADGKGDPAPEEGKDEEQKARTPEERKKAFTALMQGEYRAEAEAMMQQAVQLAAQNLQASPAMQGLLAALQEKYGTDADSLEALTEAVKNGAVKDDAYYENLAMEKGVSVKTARELDQLESQNRRLTAQQQAAQEMAKQQERQQQAAQMRAYLEQQETALKQRYPDFGQYRDEFLANPETKKMLLGGVSMETAYRAMYFDRLMEADRAATARQVEQGVVNRVQQRNARPGENGTRPGGAVQTKVDVAHMSRREMEELEKRARRGEIITL